MGMGLYQVFLYLFQVVVDYYTSVHLQFLFSVYLVLIRGSVVLGTGVGNEEEG